MRKSQSLSYGQEQQNLLNLVVPATTADSDIHTFTEFKEWMNTSFQINTQLNSSSYIKKKEMTNSLRLKQAKSFGNETVKQPRMLGSLKQRQSLSYNTLDQIQQRGQNLQNSNMGIAVNRSRRGSFTGDLGFDLQQNSIIKSRDGQSVRSYNGYEQINQYQMRELIGKGSFADVYLAVDIQSGGKQKYAIKILQTKQIKKRLLLKKNSQMIDTPPQVQEEDEDKPKEKESLASLFVRNEIAILKKMSHQYITKLKDVIFDNEKSKAYLVLQYCGGGFINQSKQKNGQYRKLLESECRRYSKQLSLALDYIHNVAKIAHRDIKPENILLNQHDQVKISDFGLGTHKLKAKKCSGTPLYMPPQAQENQESQNSQLGDIWALGVTLLVMLTGKHPEFIDHKIDVEKVISGLKDVSENCKNFINRCLQVDASKRIKADELLGHDWLGGGEMLRSTLANVNYDINITPADEQNVFNTKHSKSKDTPISLKFTFD